jgi:hypothetical protein
LFISETIKGKYSNIDDSFNVVRNMRVNYVLLCMVANQYLRSSTGNTISASGSHRYNTISPSRTADNDVNEHSIVEVTPDPQRWKVDGRSCANYSGTSETHIFSKPYTADELQFAKFGPDCEEKITTVTKCKAAGEWRDDTWVKGVAEEYDKHDYTGVDEQSEEHVFLDMGVKVDEPLLLRYTPGGDLMIFAEVTQPRREAHSKFVLDDKKLHQPDLSTNFTRTTRTEKKPPNCPRKQLLAKVIKTSQRSRIAPREAKFRSVMNGQRRGFRTKMLVPMQQNTRKQGMCTCYKFQDNGKCKFVDDCRFKGVDEPDPKEMNPQPRPKCKCCRKNHRVKGGSKERKQLAEGQPQKGDKRARGSLEEAKLLEKASGNGHAGLESDFYVSGTQLPCRALPNEKSKVPPLEVLTSKAMSARLHNDVVCTMVDSGTNRSAWTVASNLASNQKVQCNNTGTLNGAHPLVATEVETIDLTEKNRRMPLRNALHTKCMNGNVAPVTQEDSVGVNTTHQKGKCHLVYADSLTFHAEVVTSVDKEPVNGLKCVKLQTQGGRNKANTVSASVIKNRQNESSERSPKTNCPNMKLEPGGQDHHAQLHLNTENAPTPSFPRRDWSCKPPTKPLERIGTDQLRQGSIYVTPATTSADIPFNGPNSLYYHAKHVNSHVCVGGEEGGPRTSTSWTSTTLVTSWESGGSMKGDTGAESDLKCRDLGGHDQNLSYRAASYTKNSCINYFDLRTSTSWTSTTLGTSLGSSESIKGDTGTEKDVNYVIKPARGPNLEKHVRSQLRVRGKCGSSTTTRRRTSVTRRTSSYNAKGRKSSTGTERDVKCVVRTTTPHEPDLQNYARSHLRVSGKADNSTTTSTWTSMTSVISSMSVKDRHGVKGTKSGVKRVVMTTTPHAPNLKKDAKNHFREGGKADNSTTTSTWTSTTCRTSSHGAKSKVDIAGTESSKKSEVKPFSPETASAPQVQPLFQSVQLKQPHADTQAAQRPTTTSSGSSKVSKQEQQEAYTCMLRATGGHDRMKIQSVMDNLTYKAFRNYTEIVKGAKDQLGLKSSGVAKLNANVKVNKSAQAEVKSFNCEVTTSQENAASIEVIQVKENDTTMHVHESVLLPKGQVILKVKWVYDQETDKDGEEVNCDQPTGREGHYTEYVWELKKALDGLVRAGGQWQKHMKASLKEIGCKVSLTDPNTYYKHQGETRVIVLVRGHDLYPTYNKVGKGLGNELAAHVHLAKHLRNKFQAELELVIKVRIFKDVEAGILKLPRVSYVWKVLTRYNLLNCKTVYLLTKLSTWCTVLSRRVPTSTIEVEYNDLEKMLRETKWQTNLPKEIGLFKATTIPTCEDNTTSVQLSSTKVHHQRSKHFSLEWYAVKEVVCQKMSEILPVWNIQKKVNLQTKSASGAVYTVKMDTVKGGGGTKRYLSTLVPPLPILHQK